MVVVVVAVAAAVRQVGSVIGGVWSSVSVVRVFVSWCLGTVGVEVMGCSACSSHHQDDDDLLR